MKKFAALYCDISNSSDNRPHMIGIFDSREKAENETITGIEQFCKTNNIKPTLGMFTNMAVNDEYGTVSRVWNIVEFEMEFKVSKFKIV